MTDPLDRILKLVAEGHMTAADAAPILDALAKAGSTSGAAGPGAAGDGSEPAGDEKDVRRPRFARIEVREAGRRVVDLRIPISLGRFALTRVPGLSSEQIAEVEEAVASGSHGAILDVQDPDGDGVRILLE